MHDEKTQQYISEISKLREQHTNLSDDYKQVLVINQDFQDKLREQEAKIYDLQQTIERIQRENVRISKISQFRDSRLKTVYDEQAKKTRDPNKYSALESICFILKTASISQFLTS